MNKEEILKQIEINKNTLQSITPQIMKLQSKKGNLQADNDGLRKQLNLLEAKENNSCTAYWFLKLYPDMKYIGKANGKIETSEGNISAQCRQCKEDLELFKGNTEIGAYTYGVCPLCKLEINFTNYGEW